MPNKFFNPDASLVAHQYQVYIWEATEPLTAKP